MEAFNQLISNEITSALGWTLVHIIWQGFAIALILGVVLRLLGNSSSQIRYLISIMSLVMILGLSIYNFTASYKREIKVEKQTLTSNPDTETTIINQDALLQVLEPNSFFWQSVINRFKRIDTYFPILVNIWLAGVCIFMLKFMVGLLYIQRIKSRSASIIKQDWIDRFRKIERKLSVRKRIRYLESTIVKVPAVLGYLKPVILIPAGMLTGIPENQIEAIVAHELAHIRRNDFLVNILQSFIEMIFFFHPAVWYISSQIRTERENCCDDIAITLCDGSLTYAKALVSIQELYPGKIYSAVAFSGQKRKLLNRIKRVIMSPNTESNINDRIIATLIVLIGIALATFSLSLNPKPAVAATLDSNEFVVSSFINAVPEKPMVKKIVSVDKSIVKDTLKKTYRGDEINILNNTIVKTYRDKDDKKMKEMKFTLKNGSVSELYIDGKKIPESEYPKYQPEIDETIEDLKDAKEDIRKAMIEIENIDIERIKAEVAESMKDVKIDMVKMQDDIARAMEDIPKVDVEKILKEVQFNLQSIEKVDIEKQIAEIQKSIAEVQCINMEEIKRQMEEAKRQIENIDFEKIRAEIEFNKQQIHESIDYESIKKEMQRVHEELSKLDFAKINLELDESFDGIDKEKMINEMQEELKKLEGLELDKK